MVITRTVVVVLVVRLLGFAEAGGGAFFAEAVKPNLDVIKKAGALKATRTDLEAAISMEDNNNNIVVGFR